MANIPGRSSGVRSEGIVGVDDGVEVKLDSTASRKACAAVLDGGDEGGSDPGIIGSMYRGSRAR